MAMHSAIKGKLIAVIGDEDTCVGFLLGGIGEINKNRQSNFMVVDKNTSISEIEETFKRFLRRDDIDIILINQNAQLDFHRLLRSSVRCESQCFALRILSSLSLRILRTNTRIAEMIRHVIDTHTTPVPAVLEIPSKDHPYDPTKDSILRRARGMFNPEEFR